MQDAQSTGFTLVTHLLYLLVAIGAIGISVEYTKCLDRPADHLMHEGLPLEMKDRSDKQLLRSKTKTGLFFLSFSFTRNIRKLTSVGKGGGGDGFDPKLEVFAGVRTMSMMYVILAHVTSNFIMGINFGMV